MNLTGCKLPTFSSSKLKTWPIDQLLFLKKSDKLLVPTQQKTKIREEKYSPG